MLLKILAWVHKLGGMVFAFIAVSGLVSGAALNWPWLAGGLSYPLAIIVFSATSVVLLATGFLLARRSRIGGILALILALYPFAFAIAERRSVSLAELLIEGLTIVALLVVWRELDWHPAASA
jgi:hypothetical protein